MSILMDTIQHVRSLRKDLSSYRLPAGVAKSIDTIKQTLLASADQSGWKKVDWRSAPSRPSHGQSQSHGQTHGQSHGQSQNGHRGSYHGHPSHSHPNTNGWTTSRPSHHSRDGDRGDRKDRGEGNHPFHRAKGGSTTHREVLPSIPLTYASSATSSIADQGFEVVRRGRRADHSHSGPVEFRTPPQKYVSKFKKATDKVEDTILNTILLGKLNKFSAANYADIKEFITQIIDSGQTEMMTCFMKLVFEKAASEEIFCPLYAKLLSELSAQYPILLQEMATLYAQYMAIFVEVSDEPDKTHQEFVQRNVEKKYRRGYSQFLAELTKHNVIDSRVFIQTVNKIVEQIELNQTNAGAVKLVEELADCLVRMLKAIHMDRAGGVGSSEEKEEETTASVIRAALKEEAGRIQPLTVRRPEATGISNKARFTFMDIYEGIQK